jgi:hypothetical protein
METFDCEVWAEKARVARIFDRDGFVAVGTPDEVFAAWDREEARRAMQAADAEIGRLRAILAPLLEKPLFIGWDDGRIYEGDGFGHCVFCREWVSAERWYDKHADDCPVLHQDDSPRID